MRLRAFHRCATLATVVLVAASCGDEPVPLAPRDGTLYVTPTGRVTTNPPEIFVGAGDIASCSKNDDELTAQILDTVPGTVYLLGDNVYPDGTDSEFANCYHPTWGRHKARTKPSAGNHDYNTPGASGYYNYFGAAAGDPSEGYYSYDLGAWHIIVLNSNISKSSSSPQVQWLNADLAAHPNQCKLAYFHHPLYSATGGSGSGGRTYSGVRDLIEALYAGGVDVYLAGHRHHYERMSPMAPDGSYDPNGIRTFIVGSGGIGGGGVSNQHPLTELANGDTRGVLKMYLYEDSYAWRFIPIQGKTFTDTGSVACHTAGGPPPPPGGVSASQSMVDASPGTITASTGSNSSIITVTARDGNGDPVEGVTVTLAATGSGNTITQPAAPTDANGVATGSISSTGAGAKTITATADGVTLNDEPTVTVTPGPVSAARSSVSADPTSIVAGGGSATITVTVRDAWDNPIGGSTVTLQATGAGNTLTQPAAPTDASGVATGSLSSSATGSKTVSATAGSTALDETATVTVTDQPPPSPLGHTLLTVGYHTSNQRTYTTDVISPAPNALVTVAVMGHRSSGTAPPPTITGGGMAQWDVVATATFDNVSNPRKRVTVFRAMSATPGSGPLTIAFDATQSNSQWIVSQWTGVETGGTNGSGAIGQVGAANGDGVGGLLVNLGAFSSPINLAYGVFGVESSSPAITPGAGFTLIAEQPSNEGTKSDLMAEYASNDPTVDASWNSLDGGGVAVEIRATAGNLSPSASFTPSCTDLSCVFTSTSSDPDGTIVSSDWTFGDGNTGAGTSVPHTYSSDGTYTVELTVTDDAGASSSTSQQVTVEQRVATALAFIQQPTNTEADAPITPAVEIEIVDQFGDRLTTATNDVTVAIGTNPAGGSLSGTKTMAASGGVATFAGLSIDQIATGYTLVASSSGLTGATSTAFDVTGPAPSPGLSEVAAAPGTIAAGGTGSTITVTARDGSGNPIAGATVMLSATGSGNTLTQPTGPTNAGGVATGSLTSTVAGAKVVSATINGVGVTETATVTVIPGPPSGSASTVEADPGTITVTSGSATITVTVTDDYGNPVAGATVILDATGTGNTLTQPGPTGADGVTTGALSSSVPETKTVSASANGTPIAGTVDVEVTDQPPAVPITHTLLTVGYHTTNGKVYTTEAISPAPNTLITIAVLGHRSYGANAPPEITGGGMSAWDVVHTVVFDPESDGRKRATIYRAMSPAPGSGPLTITFESSVSNTQWIVSQWNGVATGGTNGSGAIGLIGAASGDGVNGLTVDLGAFANPANVAYGVFGAGTNQPELTPGAGFTLIAQQPSMEGTPADLLAEWAVDRPAITATWSNLPAGALGVEIRAASGP